MRRLLCLLAIAAMPFVARAQGGGLTHVDGPKGGHVVFGAVSGAPSASAAMGFVLRSLHQQFGARPEVGRVFALKDSDAIAVNFTAQPPNVPRRGGMIVIARGANGYEAGVVSDEAAHLQASFTPMLQTLFASWHPGAPANAASPGRPALPLRPYTLPDRTASVGLPQGWTVAPISGGGTIFANGPRGEGVALGYAQLVIDTSVPAGRQLQQQSMGALRNTVYANNLYYPYGQSLGRTFVDLNRLDRELHHAQPAPLRLDSEEPIAQQGSSRCAHLRGAVAPHDGQGAARLDTIFCVAPPERSANSWIAMSYTSVIPDALVDEQRATVAAIVASFQEDRAAVQRMANQIAAPVIAQIREIGRISAQRAAEADATRIATRQSYEARSNVQDRVNQGFSNYLRDQTVVVDRDNDTHETMWNQSADSLVKSDPKRYGYVDTPEFWKGVDY